MNTEIINETQAQSLAGAIAFPDVVRALVAEGVESYHADLVRREKTYYLPDGRTHVSPMGIAPGVIAGAFSADAVSAAIRESQQGRITYREFLLRIEDAGTTSYVVYLAGRRAIYFGREGNFHVEEFPRK